jgi:hydrogenase-4 component B
MSEPLLLLGIAVAAASGVPGLFLSRKTNTGQWLSTLLAVAGAGLGLAGVGAFVLAGDSEENVWQWPAFFGQGRVGIDGISTVFLLPVFLVFALGSIYGLGYWKQTEHPDDGRGLRLFYGLTAAGMALLVIARDGILFLMAWEVMALSAFFLVTTEDRDREVRRAGWVYLVATHVGTLALVALFALLRSASGSFTLTPIPEEALTPGLATAIFVLALVGFGLKAGIMPLHVWLPSAHASAPSHVSALMSGVLIKMGIYGLVRVTALLPAPPVEWGATLLVLGAVSGILGVAFAIGQHDLKRLLAYHSIENIGIIVIGLGLALVGRSLEQPAWVVLGLGGALLHVWNHALFKALLFLGAGSVIHATHTREIDHLGGLAKPMPRTALLFLIGAVAICGLPPLNGFVSEFLIYLGLFGTLAPEEGSSFAGAAFAAPALALIGTLAVACFVKVFGAVFLGTARSEHAAHAHESGLAMLGPMVVLAACCFLIGIAPRLLTPILDEAISTWAREMIVVRQMILVRQLERMLEEEMPFLEQAPTVPGMPAIADQAPLYWISFMAVLLFAGLMLAGGLLWSQLRRGGVTRGPTWGCGYLAATPRIQYTSSSFAQMLVGLFGWVLRPRTRAPHNLPLFPGKSSFHSEVHETVLDEAVRPAFRRGAWLCGRLQVFQQGGIQSYLLYIFIILIVLLLWP